MSLDLRVPLLFMICRYTALYCALICSRYYLHQFTQTNWLISFWLISTYRTYSQLRVSAQTISTV